jgi:hypothetical protein
MDIDASAVDRDAQLRLKQAQAMLDLFEADRQRAAVTLEEMKEWATAQDQELLQSRIDHYLEFESEVRRAGCRVRPVSPSIVPVSVLEPATNGPMVQNPEATDFALEAEIAIVIRRAGITSDNFSTLANHGGPRSWWRRLRW